MEYLNAVSSISVPFSHILKAGYSGGSLSVPVNDPTGISTRFKHITGVPLLLESSNVSYTRLRQLDMLIDQISKLKDRGMGIDFESFEPDQLQHIIDNLAYELRRELDSISATHFGIYSSGNILNMTA